MVACWQLIGFLNVKWIRHFAGKLDKPGQTSYLVQASLAILLCGHWSALFGTDCWAGLSTVPYHSTGGSEVQSSCGALLSLK